MLRVHSDNCPVLKKTLESSWADYKAKITPTYKDLLATLSKYFGTDVNLENAKDYCVYLKWANLNEISLKLNYTDADIIGCDNLMNSLYMFLIENDEKLGYISSNEFLKKLNGQLKVILGHITYHESYFY